jgi:hypothetical protein
MAYVLNRRNKTCRPSNGGKNKDNQLIKENGREAQLPFLKRVLRET